MAIDAKTKTRFCAAIEPFGLRDMARIDPVEYKSRLNALLQVLQAILVKNSTTSVVLAVHTCFMSEDDFDSLVDTIARLRTALMRSTTQIPLRGFVTKGNVVQTPFADWQTGVGPKRQTWRNPEITAGFTLNEIAGDMMGRLQKLKAIAIQVDDQVAERIRNSKPGIRKNCFYADSKSRRLIDFYELSLREEDLEDEILQSVVKEFHSAFHRSRKEGRFFIPLFYSWCNVLTKSCFGIGDKSRKSLDKLFVNGFFASYKDLPGLNLLYCRFLESVFRLSHERNLEEEQVAEIILYFRKHRWVHEMIRSDGEAGVVPENTLSEAAKRWYIKKLAELIELS